MSKERETVLTRQLLKDDIARFEDRFEAGRERERVKRAAMRDAALAAKGWAGFAGGQAYRARLTQRAVALDAMLEFAAAPEVEATVAAMRDAGAPVGKGLSRVFGFITGDLPEGMMVALRRSDGAALSTTDVDSIGKYQIDTPCTDKEVLVEVQDGSGQLLLQDGAPITLRDGETIQRNFTITRCGDIMVEDPTEGDNPAVLMPALVDGTEKIAKAKLGELGDFPVVYARSFDDAPRGTVIAQAPVADAELSADSQISLTISDGPEPQAKMPDLKDQPLTEARAILTDFSYGTLSIDYVDAPQNVGRVVKQTPQAGKPLADNAKVTLCIGQAQKVMPDVVGRPESAARATLVPKIVTKVQIGFVEVPGTPGLVETQEPAKGSVVTDQTEVILQIGKPPEIQDIVMPDLKGGTVADGRRALKALGDFEVGVNETVSDVKKGRVFQHEPDKGSKITPGDLITLHVSKGAEDTLTMPRVLGLSLARAKDALVPKYTRDIAVKYATSNMETGKVIQQAPKEGQQVVVDDTVSLTVSQAPVRRNVPVMPDLTGLKITEAKRQIASAKLQKLDYSKTDARKRNWQIVAQDPAPGAVLRGDETVIVTFGPKT